MDDNFTDHPKVDALSDSAFRLHVAGLCYCAKHLTDGHVPADRVGRLVPRFRRSALDELMERRLWLPADAGYSIHDYLDWNDSREHVIAQRERLRKVRSEAGRKGAQARWQTA
jgi:hypothetical protein